MRQFFYKKNKNKKLEEEEEEEIVLYFNQNILTVFSQKKIQNTKYPSGYRKGI